VRLELKDDVRLELKDESVAKMEECGDAVHKSDIDNDAVHKSDIDNDAFIDSMTVVHNDVDDDSMGGSVADVTGAWNAKGIWVPKTSENESISIETDGTSRDDEAIVESVLGESNDEETPRGVGDCVVYLESNDEETPTTVIKSDPVSLHVSPKETDLQLIPKSLSSGISIANTNTEEIAINSKHSKSLSSGISLLPRDAPTPQDTPRDQGGGWNEEGIWVPEEPDSTKNATKGRLHGQGTSGELTAPELSTCTRVDASTNTNTEEIANTNTEEIAINSKHSKGIATPKKEEVQLMLKLAEERRLCGVDLTYTPASPEVDQNLKTTRQGSTDSPPDVMDVQSYMMDSAPPGTSPIVHVQVDAASPLEDDHADEQGPGSPCESIRDVFLSAISMKIKAAMAEWAESKSRLDAYTDALEEVVDEEVVDEEVVMVGLLSEIGTSVVHYVKNEAVKGELEAIGIRVMDRVKRDAILFELESIGIRVMEHVSQVSFQGECVEDPDTLLRELGASVIEYAREGADDDTRVGILEAIGSSVAEYAEEEGRRVEETNNVLQGIGSSVAEYAEEEGRRVEETNNVLQGIGSSVAVYAEEEGRRVEAIAHVLSGLGESIVLYAKDVACDLEESNDALMEESNDALMEESNDALMEEDIYAHAEPANLDGHGEADADDKDDFKVVSAVEALQNEDDTRLHELLRTVLCEASSVLQHLGVSVMSRFRV